jgi:hypothetical protein
LDEGAVTPLEVVVLIVSDDRAAVEADLAAGRLLCPCCGRGVLGGWGCARLRQVRMHVGVRWLRPRRGRCREESCAATHVLLPDVCLARRVYVAEVIGGALVSAGREGYRRAGERLGVPGETVRDWRRRFRAHAEVIAAHFLGWARALDASLDPPVGQGSSVADALEAIGVCTRVASLGAAVQASVVVGVGADRGWAASDQHEIALACA